MKTKKFNNIPLMEKFEPLVCDICGHNMRNLKTGITIVGFRFGISFNPEDDVDTGEIQRIEDTFGKLSFNICLVCLLKAYGIKTLEEKKIKLTMTCTGFKLL